MAKHDESKPLAGGGVPGEAPNALREALRAAARRGDLIAQFAKTGELAPAKVKEYYFDLPATAGSIKTRLTLPTGLYVMPGVKTSGKTVNLRALMRLLRKTRAGSAFYAYMYEPRAELGVFNTPLDFTDDLTAVLNTDRRIQVFGADSLTYAISPIGSSLLAENEEDVTYEKGLRLSDLRAIRALDNLARVRGVALIATLNSELFPRVDALEGACEGMVSIKGPGSLTIRSRSTRREDPVNLEATFKSVVDEMYPGSSSATFTFR